MPILKLLYNADDHNAHHIYMSLIILLILSQDENFNKSVHELVQYIPLSGCELVSPDVCPENVDVIFIF